MTPAPHRSTNPFQFAVLAVGFLFAVTACSYGVMYVQQLQPAAGQPSAAGRWLLQLLDQHGGMLLSIELALLAAVSAAAMLSERRPPA